MRLFKKQSSTQYDAPVFKDGVEEYRSEGDSEKQIESGAHVSEHADFDPALERRVVRKLDWHVVPLVFALYLLAFLDRSNIGNAETAGLYRGIHLGGPNSPKYTWLLTIFYISYILFEPLILMWKIVPPHYWAAFVVLVWGIASSCLAATSSWAGAMVLRFIMGASEAAYGPGIPYLLSFFYLRHEVGFRAGIFLAAAPLASTFAGALAYGITSGHAAIANWRLLFLVEGLPTIVMAPIAFFFLPDSPDQARFLSQEEKEVARARGVRQVGKSGAKRVGSIDLKETAKALLDYKPWFTALMYFSTNVSFASLPVFLPIILEQMGYSSVNAQGLSAPPYFLSFLVTISTVWVADKTQQRAWFVVGLSIIGCIGYIILATVESVGARYFAVFLVAGGVFPTIANILPWVSNNQGSDERRGAAFVMLNMIGQCGPILGTRVYPRTDAPRFVTGHSVCAGFMGFTTILAICLRILLVLENRKFDRQFGTVREQNERLEKNRVNNGGVSEKQAEGDAVENYGPLYRYVL